MASQRQTVSIPVEATVGPISIGLHAERHDVIGGWQEPDTRYMPWAVTARCPVTFHFGQFVVSKAIKGRFQFRSYHKPTAEEVALAAGAVDAEVVERLRFHGLDASSLDRVAYAESDPLPEVVS